MSKKCKNATADSQTILHGDTLYNIRRKKYKTGFAEKVTFDRMVMILNGISTIFCFICYAYFWAYKDNGRKESLLAIQLYALTQINVNINAFFGVLSIVMQRLFFSFAMHTQSHAGP